MVSSSDDIFSVLPSRVAVQPGATLAVFVDIVPGEKSLLIKYLSGGTLEILPASLGASFVPGTSTYGSYAFTAGSTQTAAMLAVLSGTGYLMGTSEALTFDGAPRLYLSSTGATSVVAIIKSLSSGF